MSTSSFALSTENTYYGNAEMKSESLRCGHNYLNRQFDVNGAKQYTVSLHSIFFRTGIHMVQGYMAYYGKLTYSF